MQKIHDLGCAVIGEYTGDGHGDEDDTDTAYMEDVGDVDAQIFVDDLSEENSSEKSSDDKEEDDSKPLLFFFDCETTGLSIYKDHLTEVAAEVVGHDSHVSQHTFSSLVRTTRQIPVAGTQKLSNDCCSN